MSIFKILFFCLLIFYPALSLDKNIQLTISKEMQNLKPTIDLFELVKLMAKKTDRQITDGLKAEVFYNEINYEGITIVKFSKIGCPPCKKFAPEFNKIAKENQNKNIKFLEINNYSIFLNLINRLNIHAYPTVSYFKNGKTLRENTVGIATSISVINQIIENIK